MLEMAQLEATLLGRKLLQHCFYERWSRGEVSSAELQSYAAQYRHFEAFVPELLQGMIDAEPGTELARQAGQNYADEVEGPCSHLELFERFAQALDAPRDVAPSPAMANLLDTYRAALEAGGAPAFAALWAYESQSPGVSATKAAGLREHHGLKAEALAFWDAHAVVDATHAAWAYAAIQDAPVASTLHWARAGADAWWAFLDEREALRPTSPSLRASAG